MPYSTGCATPLSNFEATQDYKDVQDPAITVCFPMDDDPNVNIIAWTTTPWTLPSNLALCVHPDLDYVKVKVIYFIFLHTGRNYFDACTLICSNDSLLHILGQQDRKIVHLNGGKTKGGF